MFVANFTPDTIEWMHIGITGKIVPGDVTEFDDARGKFILSRWGARGLVRMDWGDKDNEDEKRQESMEIYTKFWERQIENFNNQNEARKNENKPYISPTPILSDKADELGIRLHRPWRIETDKGPNKKELDALKSDVNDLKDIISNLTELVKSTAAERNNAYIEQFDTLDGDEFKDFVNNNIKSIRKWPPEVQESVQAKWESTQDSELYPLSA